MLRQLPTLLFHRDANRVAKFAASDAASRDYHPVAKLLQIMLPRRCQPCCEAGARAANRKNLLLWWRYRLVGAASEPLWLRVAGGRRGPAY